MKAVMYDVKGKKKSDVALPDVFETEVREDIIQKALKATRVVQPYAATVRAGRRQSAAGTISHKRHDWKGHYGKGIARLPRKTMWRRGTQFYWIGANVPGTRGGPKAHPPKGIGKEKSMNKKEFALAMNGALAATADKKFVQDRYATLSGEVPVPVVLEAVPEKTAELLSVLKSMFGEAADLVEKKKSVRAGKGTLRGRKYKSNAGVLILTGAEEKVKSGVVESKPVDEVTLHDLYPLGRLTVFTKAALEELGGEGK
jgi:large subunit ribosomal protein L4e